MQLQLESRNISKSFGLVHANQGISLSFQGGRIYAILGENGAGKTTFLSILSGLYKPDEGSILVNGEKVHFKSPRDALSRGIYLVQQNFSLISTFTVAENLALPQGASPGRLNLNEVVKRAHLGSNLDPKAIIRGLPLNFRQLLEIQKALLYEASILLLDEPTSVLGPHQAGELAKTLRALASEGKLIVVASHKLKEVFDMCDHFVVMRRGQAVYSGSRAEIESTVFLIHKMFGEDLIASLPAKEAARNETVLEVANLEVRDRTGHRDVVNKASLAVRSGQILGIAGVAGNGQKELAEAIYGLRKLSGGVLRINGSSVVGGSTLEIRKMGVGYIPEEGAIMGVVPDFTLAENLSLTTFDLINSSSLVDKRVIEERAEELIKDYGIVPSDRNLAARYLSGGNMQKLIVARELSRALGLLISYNPTKGLDIRTRLLVHQKHLEKRNTGTAILLISEDLEEILEMSDDVAVMSKGRIVGLGEARRLTVQEIGHMMSG